ncbi:MAG TPA: acetyl-CoA carboxylase biotin carboxyl carrier protein [Candidatus Binataceae bacterium]|nr:acetyl-CoA carboxylase biotin carboxyl carrier protein [Candidatus Binataceae bacterium]
MELRELKALLNLMHENGLVELELEDKKGKVRLVRGVVALHDHQPKQAAVAIAPSKGSPSAAKSAAKGEKPTAGPIELEDNQKLVESPMVGTFYRAASPDSDPFVEEGNQVRKGEPLCIIEAMKMMNEIEADTAGRVVRFLVDNGSPVEYGQPLMILEIG